MLNLETLLTTGNLLYAGATTLILIGIAGMVLQRHLLRILLALTLVEAGVNLFLIAAGFRPNAAAPIAVAGQFPASMVDPIPQALVLTAIVIGVGVLALALALALQLQRYYGTLDMAAIAARLHAAPGRGSSSGLPVEPSHSGKESAS